MGQRTSTFYQTAFNCNLVKWIQFPTYSMINSEIHFVYNMCVCSVPSNSVTPWNCPGKNTGVGLPFPTPGDLLNSGIKPCLWSLLDWQWMLYHHTAWEALYVYMYIIHYIYIHTHTHTIKTHSNITLKSTYCKIAMIKPKYLLNSNQQLCQ